MRHLDEVGHLGGPGQRTTANLGIAKVFVETGGDLRFEGNDAAGKLWRVWIPGAGGLGGTDVWTADFDRNGRPDLVIATYFPGNGRCIDAVTIYTLLFDDLGRPVPWIANSNSFAGFGQSPVMLLDANRNGRAEIATVSCEYSDSVARFGEDRQISGIMKPKTRSGGLFRTLRRSFTLRPRSGLPDKHRRGFHAGSPPNHPAGRIFFLAMVARQQRAFSL